MIFQIVISKKYLPIIIFLPFFAIDFFQRNNIIFDHRTWGSGEKGIIEILSAIILFLCLTVSLKSLKNSIRSEKKLYFLRSIFFTFLLLEEVSFITKGMFKFTNIYNKQAELNIHNSKLFHIPIGGGLDFFGITIDISLFTIICLFMTFLIGYGSFLFKKKWSYILFLDKTISNCFLILPLNLIITFILQNLRILESNVMFLHIELTECCLYFIMLTDSIIKEKRRMYN